VLVGPADGATGFKRVGVVICRASKSVLHVEVEVPAYLAGPVGNLLAAWG
jgi:hypothetical protein